MHRAESPLDQAADLATCFALLREGSKSFHAASLLLPTRIRRAVAPVYAFCRVCDDIIDRDGATAENLRGLEQRLDGIYGGGLAADPVDRAFTRVVRDAQIPRAIPEALLEGFAWEVEARRYTTLSELLAYSARVASAVGVMVTLICGRRDRETLARACELGLAMQLTNIARDVGEDARNGRVYLPLAWLDGDGVHVSRWLRDPQPHPGVRRCVERLLAVAAGLYRRSEAGIRRLPGSVRHAIWAARFVYADIGTVITANGFDSVSKRAVTSTARKSLRMLQSLLWRSTGNPHPGRGMVGLDEVDFLLAAVTETDREGAPSKGQRRGVGGTPLLEESWHVG
jgi:phytoene synthase